MPNVIALQKIGSLTVTAVSTNLTNGSIWVGDAGNLPAEVNLTETIQDLVAALLVAGTNVTLTYDDALGTITIDVASPTAAAILASLLTVDGAGSGLDADLLDGLSSAAFSLVGHTHVPGDITGFVEAIDDRVAALLVAGTNIVLTYDDALNTLTIDATAAAGYTDEQVRDVIAALLVAGTGVTLVYDDALDTLTISSTGGGSASDVKCLYNNEDLLITTNTVKVGVQDIEFTGTGNLIIEGTGRLAIV